ncbi:MAG: AMP-binding protein [Bacteroidota bacterium]|nr:AMP-binding protein [Bacteroidota bacterium]
MKNRQNLSAMHFPALLENNRQKFGDRSALGFDQETYLSYAEVHKAIQANQVRLKKHGIQPGDKVAVFAANSPQWGIAYFAIVSMGAIVVPMIAELEQHEIDTILEHSESKAIFASQRLMEKVHKTNANSLKERIVLDNILSDVQHSEEAKAYDMSIVNEDDLAAILYTSGATGTPKAVMLTHGNLITNTIQGDIVQPGNENDRFLSVLPLAHTYENTLGLLLPTLNGSCVTYLRKLPTATVLLPAMKRVKPTFMLTVPLIIEKVTRKKVFAKFEKGGIITALYKIRPIQFLLHRIAGKKIYEAFGGHLKFFGIGGAKVDKKVEQFLRDAKFPYAIGYGLTETAPLSAGSNPEFTNLQSTGPSVEGVDIKISNGEHGGTPGEILIKGPNVMKGYYKNPELTAEVFTSDGYFRSGDLGEFDNAGNLFLKGRSKNMILGSNGENIYPEDIESLINNFSFVTESIVVERKGKLVALVHFDKSEIEDKFQNFKDDIQAIVEKKLDELSEELQQFVNSKVNKHSRLQTIVVHATEFEKTATRKIKRFKYA